MSSPDEAASLTWTQFSEMYLPEYVPQSLRDAWRAEFKQLRQGTMIMSEYAVCFSELARHAPTLVATVRERVRRFIEGLHPSIRTSMASELEIDITYQQGCDACLAYVRDVSIDTPTVKSVPVVRDFPDVFPADLPYMSPDRDIDFGIDLLSGTQPIFIHPYCMAPPKLKELKEQL
ncbi:uncharacterized protein [Nicotiana tomentosiformis]|uniref:uncharacterized protein n=1 Tax=Nicotiana tomentosiformis TaxID=4098 RepID=UPI00388CB76F